MSNRVPSGPPQPQGFNEDPLTYFSKVFVRFLQLVFQTWDKGNYHWDPDDHESEIIIQDQAVVDKEVVEKRPAIIVSRGPVSMTNVSMDQFAGPLLKQKEFTPNQDPKTNTRRYTDLLAGSVNYNCLSTEGVEAQRIAWITAYATRALKRELMKVGLHRVGEDLSIGSESAPGSVVATDPHEIIMVSVQVPFFFQESWTKGPQDNLLLNKVGVTLRSELGYPAPGAVPIKEPGMNGRILSYDKKEVLSQITVTGNYKTPRSRRT